MSGNASFAHSSSSTSKKLQEWSSLIGIVTAIVGNVLISFALNLQRYAHIRLGREQEEENEQWDGGQKSKHRNYGTQQNDVAEGRARLNLTAPTQEDSLPKGLDGKNGDGLDQSDGLPLHGNSLHSRSSSDSTIRRSSEKPHPHVERKTYLRSPYWWGGIVLMTVGEAGNFLAYGFAPASIVSPLGVVALVCNCLIAPLLLKERFRQRDFWGVAVAIAGAVVIVLSAKNSETKMGPDDVWGAITRWEFELYLGITVALIILLMWASGKYGERTVLIDLGLVGLFGRLISSLHSYTDTDCPFRRLHCSVHQRRRVTSIRHPLAGPHFPNYIPPNLHTRRHGCHADTLRQSRTTTLRFYPSHPHPIRVVHNLCHSWQRNPIP